MKHWENMSKSNQSYSVLRYLWNDGQSASDFWKILNDFLCLIRILFLFEIFQPTRMVSQFCFMAWNDLVIKCSFGNRWLFLFCVPLITFIVETKMYTARWHNLIYREFMPIVLKNSWNWKRSVADGLLLVDHLILAKNYKICFSSRLSGYCFGKFTLKPVWTRRD